VLPALTAKVWKLGEAAAYQFGVERGIGKARDVMTAIADSLRKNGVTFSLAVYPLPDQLQCDVVESKQVIIWRSWCEQNGCMTFVNHFPDFLLTLAATGAIDAILRGTRISAKVVIGLSPID